MFLFTEHGNKRNLMALYTSTNPDKTKNKIWGHLAPYAGENYPTQYAGNMKGGYRSVANTTTRNAIPTSHRKHGMKVYVKSTNQTFRLASNLVTWVLLVDSTSTSLASPYTRYDYTPVDDMEKVVCLKWHDGRLEYFFRTKEKIIRNDTNRFFYTYRHHFYFSHHIKMLSEPIIVITGLSSRRTNADDITWGACHDDINSSYFDIEAFGRDYETHGKQTIHAVGRWK